MVLADLASAQGLPDPGSRRARAAGELELDDSSNKLGEVFEPLRLGYTEVQWSSDRLGRISAAMQLWEGKEQQDGMDAGRLKSHKQSSNAKKRWRSIDVLFGVAKLLMQQGGRLRVLCKVDESVDELPSAWEQLVDARQVRV